MGTPYQNTISGLLRKRTQLMREAGAIKERLSVIGNDVQALDRTLETLGFKGKHETTVTLRAATASCCFSKASYAVLA